MLHLKVISKFQNEKRPINIQKFTCTDNAHHININLLGRAEVVWICITKLTRSCGTSIAVFSNRSIHCSSTFIFCCSVRSNRESTSVMISREETLVDSKQVVVSSPSKCFAHYLHTIIQPFTKILGNSDELTNELLCILSRSS